MHSALEQDNPVLSILLVSYNSKEFLDDCLLSIRRQISISYEVVLVDNDSSDGTPEYIRRHYPWVRLVESGKNLGFTGGNNLAARESRGKYLLLLNCDTILLTDAAPGIHILEADPLVGVVGARMYGRHGEPRPSTGHFPCPWRLWKLRWQWSSPIAKPYGAPELSAFRHDWVEGSFILTTRENWFSVGGMDESGFMYGEDVEFCGHSAQRGMLTVLCARIMYIHFGGYTVERMAHAYAGYRRFHASCSDSRTRWQADQVLFLGLVARLIVFGTLAIVTRKDGPRKTSRKAWSVLRQWRKLAPRTSTRRPLRSPSDSPTANPS
jgi:GT2 family glycosyltransferase